MAAFDFIPEIWSKKIVTTLHKNLVAESICNRDYEGDVANAGDTVRLWKSSTITISTYTKNTDMSAPETPAPTEDSFTVSQLKSFHFYIDTVDETQGLFSPINAYMTEAMYAMRDTIDQFIIAKRSSFSASNQYTPSSALTSTTIYNEFLHMGRLLTDSLVPPEGRVSVISPRVLEIMNQSIGSRETGWGDEVQKNGYVGKYAGFDIYVSHNITDVSENVNSSHSGNEVVHYCLFGVRKGITLVYQIPPGYLKMYEPQYRFGKAVKGLALYDAHVIDSGAYNGYMKAWWDS